MAKKIEIDVEVKGNMKKVTLDAKAAKKGLDEAAGAADNYSKKEKGVAGATSNSTKAFAKMAQGSGGLVAAYATLAANIFAISAAYNFLKRAGDFAMLQKSQEEYAQRTGRSMALLTSRMQEATGGVLAYQDAAQAGAIGAAAGLSNDQLIGLAKIAKDASIALGRDLTDSFNRLTRGAIKAEPELLDELGIIVRLDKASADYAKTLDKNAKDLTTFEKSQAVVNAVLDQGKEKFIDLGDNVNQIARVGKAFDDLVKSVMKGLNPMIQFIGGVFADNVNALAAAFGILGLSITKALVPAAPQFQKFSDMAQGAKDRLMAAAGSGKLGQNIAAGNIGKRELTAIEKGAGAKSGSTVIDQSKMTRKQFQRDVAIMRADHARMVAANSQGFARYTANVKAYLLGMQAEHGKVMGAMKAAGAAMASGLSKVLNAVAIVGMISLAITLIKEFIEYFKDPALKRLEGISNSGTKALLEQANTVRDLVDGYDLAAGSAAGLVKQNEILANMSFDRTGMNTLLKNMKDSTEKTTFVGYDGITGERQEYTQTFTSAESEAAAKMAGGFAAQMHEQIAALEKFKITTPAVIAQKQKLAELDKNIRMSTTGTMEQQNAAQEWLKENLPGIIDDAAKLNTVLAPDAAAIKAIQQTTEGYDKYRESLRETGSMYSQFISFGNSYLQSLTQLEGKITTLDEKDQKAIQNYLGLTDAQMALLNVEQLRLKVAAKIAETKKREYDASIRSIHTQTAFVGLTKNLNPVYADVVNQAQKFQQVQDKLAQKQAEIKQLEDSKVPINANSLKIKKAEEALLKKQLAHEKGILDDKTSQYGVQYEIWKLQKDSTIRQAAQAALELDEKRLELAKERAGLEQEMRDRATEKASRDFANSSPFASLFQEEFDASARLKQAEAEKKAKLDMIAKEKEMRDKAIEMEYTLLDAKLLMLEKQMRFEADKPENAEYKDKFLKAADSVATSRASIGGETGLKQAALDNSDLIAKNATDALLDNIDKLKDAKENLGDMKKIADTGANALASGFGNAFQSIVMGTESVKGAFKSMGLAIVNAMVQVIAQLVAVRTLQMAIGLFGSTQTGPSLEESFKAGLPTLNNRYGGVVSNGKQLPGYATGGIASGSQAGYPVMMHGTEAVVPLPNGRSIPVEMQGGANNTNNVSVNVNMNGQNSQTDVQGQNQGNQLGKLLAAAVQEELQRQKRPGGILSPYGAA